MSAISVVATLSLALLVAGASGASLLDLFNWDEAEKILGKQVQSQPEDNSRNCMCKGQACVCCVNLNITLVDFGGPGCVHMKYLSPDLGFAVNVSYGKSMLHSSTIKGANAAPICLDVFSKFAQMCARFSELAPTSDGLRGCLQLEPRLLGDTQLEFPVGCFRSGPAGMHMEEDAEKEENATQSSKPEGGSTEESGEETGIDAEEFLNAVSQTAEQGIAFFSSILGIAVPKNTTELGTTTTESETPIEPSQTPESQRRGKVLIIKHPNTL